MASIITHSLVGLSAALMMPKDWRAGGFVALATIAPSLPDLECWVSMQEFLMIVFLGIEDFFILFVFPLY